MEFIKKFLGNFVELTRAYALPVTFASCTVVWAFAHYSIKYSLFNFILLVVAMSCVHLGANLFDDFIDVMNKLKTTNEISQITFERFALKARLIIQKKFSLNEIKAIILFLFAIPFCIGIYFAVFVTPLVLVFALIGGLLAIFYPISPKYTLGEFTIGLIYGPLMVNGGYLALTGEFNFAVSICSLAIFFSTIVLLHTDNLMDWEHDIKENKNTLCIKSGSKENAIVLLRNIIICSYCVILFAVLFNILNPHSLYVFLTLPIAVRLLESLKEYINIVDVKFEPRWYYGPFENWDKIKEAKIDFFMYRMYLGRNFLFLFACFLAYGTVV